MNPPAGYVPPGTPRRTSGAAIASLICGIIGCVPLYLTSILAVIFGIIGIRRTSDPRYTGRGLAIAGLVLGIVGLVVWGIIGVGAIVAFRVSQPVAQIAQQFTRNLAGENITAARAQCESKITPDELQTLADQLKQWGTFQDLTLMTRQFNQNNGETTWTFAGIARFSSGTKDAKFKLRKQPDGSFKITSANFD